MNPTSLPLVARIFAENTQIRVYI